MTWRNVSSGCSLLTLLFAVSMLSYADLSPSEKRIKAVKNIEACLRRNEVSSKECKNLNKDVQTLVELYREGDKATLPILLRFTYLKDFFGDALIGDSEGFLSEVSRLPDQAQQEVTIALAGRPFGLPLPRFETIRATLKTVPDSSPNYRIAQACLVMLETENASLLENYFPPQTFAGRGGDFEMHGISRNLHALSERSLWPLAHEKVTIYRMTVLPAFSGPETITLTILADGSGHIRFKATDGLQQHLNGDNAKTIGPQKVSEFTELVDRAQFWKMPTEVPNNGLDGADWVLEGVQDGKYHVAVRWCPGKTALGILGRTLFDLVEQKSKGIC